MSQENKYPNYPVIAGSAIVYFATELAALVAAAEAAGVVITIDLEHTDLAMGHYRMVPHIRGARLLAQGNAANRAMEAAGIDPLLLVPRRCAMQALECSDSLSIDQAKSTKLLAWFQGNGVHLATMDQLVDASYSSPRTFDSFQLTQHAITLPT